MPATPAPPKRSYTKPATPAALHPESLYTLPEFFKASGLGRTTITRARQRGVELKTLRVGRRKFIRGADAIDFIVAAAESAA